MPTSESVTNATTLLTLSSLRQRLLAQLPGVEARSKISNQRNRTRDEPCAFKKRKEKKNYVGRETLPTSIKVKETHWPRRAVSPLHHKIKDEEG
eukprot:1153712-Pelagomonas_calceolata.AAC.4